MQRQVDASGGCGEDYGMHALSLDGGEFGAKAQAGLCAYRLFRAQNPGLSREALKQAWAAHKSGGALVGGAYDGYGLVGGEYDGGFIGQQKVFRGIRARHPKATKAKLHEYFLAARNRYNAKHGLPPIKKRAAKKKLGPKRSPNPAVIARIMAQCGHLLGGPRAAPPASHKEASLAHAAAKLMAIPDADMKDIIEVIHKEIAEEAPYYASPIGPEDEPYYASPIGPEMDIMPPFGAAPEAPFMELPLAGGPVAPALAHAAAELMASPAGRSNPEGARKVIQKELLAAAQAPSIAEQIQQRALARLARRPDIEAALREAKHEQPLGERERNLQEIVRRANEAADRAAAHARRAATSASSATVSSNIADLFGEEGEGEFGLEDVYGEALRRKRCVRARAKLASCMRRAPRRK